MPPIPTEPSHAPGACQAHAAQFRPPRLQVPFSDGDMQQVIRGARRVLDEIGVLCPSAQVRKLLSSLPGARESGDRVYYGEAVVDAILADSRIPGKDVIGPDTAGRAKLSIAAPWCCLNIADVAAGRVRPATSAEAARAVRLLEAVGAEVGVAPVAAGDVPAEMANLAGLRTVLKHSRTGRSLTNQPAPQQLETAIEMGAAAGRPPRAFIMVMISPLRYDTDGLEYFLRYREKPGIELGLSGAMPCTGATSPLHLPGTLIQALAEMLAMAACQRALGMGGTVAVVRCDPCDFRTGNYVIGSPEFQLLDMASRALYRALTGTVRTGGAFRSMAKFPDAQAMAERSFTVLFQALQGARHFGHAGQLSMDELFSGEQVVLDLEILRQVERIVGGMAWDEQPTAAAAADSAVEMIRRGVATGHYLDADETLAGCRDFFHTSDLFGYEKLQTWVHRGSPAVLHRAGQRVAELVDSTSECVLPPDQAREVDRIFHRACRA
jgi:trimethylamine:corrinoid methyltransferase-like protein